MARLPWIRIPVLRNVMQNSNVSFSWMNVNKSSLSMHAWLVVDINGKCVTGVFHAIAPFPYTQQLYYWKESPRKFFSPIFCIGSKFTWMSTHPGATLHWSTWVLAILQDYGIIVTMCWSVLLSKYSLIYGSESRIWVWYLADYFSVVATKINFTITYVSINVKLVAIITRTSVTSIWILTVVVATPIVAEALINIWMCV